MAILVNTFSVAMENAGAAKENGLLREATPLKIRLTRRNMVSAPTTSVRAAPPLITIFPWCNPRTLIIQTLTRQATPAATSSALFHHPRAAGREGVGDAVDHGGSDCAVDGEDV